MTRFSRGLLLCFGFLFLVTRSLSAATITINALGDTIIQDDNNDGIANSMFGLGGFGAGSLGAFTQANKPTQTAFVADRDAIRFDLNSLVGQSVTSASLRLVQRNDTRGLQAGTESVFGFLDDATPELDDYSGGTLLGTITAPGIVGAVINFDVTLFIQSGLGVVGPGNDFAVFRLQDPVTSDTTSNPFSLSFSNDRTPGGPLLQLIVNTADVPAVPEPGTLLLLLGGLGIGGARRMRGKR